MDQACVLALDVGTSSVRAALYDERGAAVPGAAARVPHRVRYLPDGGVETDADELLAAVVGALDRCLADVRAPLAAVGVSCFWHSLMGAAADLRPLTPVLLWADTRSAADAAGLARRLDGEAVRRRTGCRLHPSYPTAKLSWVARTRPDWWGAVRHWLSFGEYLTHWLCGELAASVSMASASGLYDQVAGAWDREVLAALDLEPVRLPPLVDLGEAVWRCRQGGRWPALAGAAVLPAVGDGACNNLGSGCVGEGALALMIGTSAASRALRLGGPWLIPETLWQYRLDRRRGLVGGALSNGGNLHQWLLETLRLPSGAAGEGDLDAAVDRLPPDGHGLTVLPLLAGERSPQWAPAAFGAVVGLREATTPLDLLRAGMESVALRVAAIVRDLDAVVGGRPRIVGSGGALWHSRAWAQILADALGRDLERSAEPEASSRGAALLALEAVGAAAASVPAVPRVDGTVRCDPARQRVYAQAWARQQRLYSLLRSDGLVGFDAGAGPETAAAAVPVAATRESPDAAAAGDVRGTAAGRGAGTGRGEHISGE